MKITRFQDVPEMTRPGRWQCHYPMTRVWRFVEEQKIDSNLDLDPDFQRGHVWTSKQQTAWLEFFMRGGQTSRVIYFNSPSWHGSATTDYDDFVIVDGKQRLESIRRFMENEIKVFGSYFDEYTDGCGPSGPNLEINVNDLQTREDVLKWYLDMNEGGVKHSDDELNRVRELVKLERRKRPRRRT